MGTAGLSTTEASARNHGVPRHRNHIRQHTTKFWWWIGRFGASECLSSGDCRNINTRLPLPTSLSPNPDSWRRNLGAPQLCSLPPSNHRQRHQRHMVCWMDGWFVGWMDHHTYVRYCDGIARNEDVAMFDGGVVSWSELRSSGA